MKNIFRFSALIALLMGLAACSHEELSTDQFSDDSVVFGAFAPNPVVRGAELRIMGSNLDKIVEVQIPGSEPITDIEVISSGRISEIRVVTPAAGAEEESVTGPVVIIDNAGKTYQSKTDISFTEGIVLDSFTPASAMPGDVVTVKGDYLYNVQQVVLSNGVYVTGDQITEKSRRELKFIVPSNAVTGPVTIGDVDENNNPDGLIPNNVPSKTELVIGDPTVKAADRGMLKAGAEITVQGAYLDMIAKAAFRVTTPAAEEGAEPTVADTEVDFALAEDNKSVKVVLPASVVEGEIVLTSFAGKEFKAGAYTTVIPTDVAIAAETRYKAGLNAVVTGKDLDLVTGATLAGTNLEFGYADGKISFAIPAAAVDGTVALTLANGKTVETEAIELVKPVITSMTPLELYAGDENITVSGEDLDLVTGATLGGKAAEFILNEDGTIEVITDVTAVSGKVILTLDNGVSVESADEVKINYHALVIVNSMPSAEHIGAKITLTGANFMLVENIFIGDSKVQSYFTRTDEEVSFVMPWNKVGSYNIYFDLLNGDREMVATPIEVLLEINYITGWEGNTEITWNVGGRVCVTADMFEGVKPGSKMRFYYTQKDQVWAQAQINYGDWSGITFPEIGSNTLVPTDIYGWFSDGILDRCTEVTLTKEILDNIQAKKGDYGDENIKNVGLLIQGSDLIFTKVEILQEISQEITIYEGPTALTWGDDGRFGLAMNYFEGLNAGAKMIVYFSQTDAWGQVQFNDGWWANGAVSFPELGGAYLNTDNAGGKDVTKMELTLTQELLDHIKATAGDYWGTNSNYHNGDTRVAFVIQGSDWIIEKITILP